MEKRLLLWGPATLLVEPPGLFWGKFVEEEPREVWETPGRPKPGTHKTSRRMVLMKIRTKRQPPDPR